MARLIPDFISDECKSSAERRLFARFRDELSDEFTILHSLGVARHRYKLYSEADFVLVHRQAVIVFEVKGGRVTRKDGCWFFTNRYGEMHRRRESPMQQAASVCAALRNSVSNHFRADSPQGRVAFGPITFLPDTEFKVSSPEWDLRRVYDVDAWGRPLREIVADAIAYSRGEVARTTGYAPGEMTRVQIDDLVQFLRGDFEKLPTLSVTLNDCEQQMIQLAPQQYSILARLSRNPRIVIEGSAGTGKTLLAMECARRHAAQGRRVLFVCFSRLLADHLDAHTTRQGLRQGISIDTLHGHCFSVINATELPTPHGATRREFYADIVPQQVAVAIAKLKNFRQWDVLVVDEGQDLAAHPPFVRALEGLFAGGFTGGSWIWFEDPRQRILRQSDGDAFDLTSFNPAYFTLTRNWRNTNEIATFTCVSTMMALPELSGIRGPNVRCVVCDGTRDLISLHILIKEVLDQGARPEDIVLLTAAAEGNALFTNSSIIASKTLVRYDSSVPQKPDTIRYSSVFRFKGLEAEIIILTDLRDLKSDNGRMAAYVGMSRAKSALYVLLSKDANCHFESNRLHHAETCSPCAK
jgi:hypothetical protein